MAEKLNKHIVELGRKIKRKRLHLLITQEALAERCNLHPNYIGQVERGQKNPSYITLLSLAKGLECSPKEFFD